MLSLVVVGYSVKHGSALSHDNPALAMPGASTQEFCPLMAHPAEFRGKRAQLPK